MERYFIVDYARIKEQPFSGLDGAETLNENDTLLLLLPDENQSISFSALKKITAGKANLVQQILPDASDTSAECILGYLIGKYYQAQNEVFLITDDRHCFEYLQTFTAEETNPVNILAFHSIGEALKLENSKKANENFVYNALEEFMAGGDT